MKNILFCIIFLFCISITGKAQSFPDKPNQIKIITSDLDHFWQAYDHWKAGNNLKKSLEDFYFAKASEGLKAFVAQKITSSDALTKAILKHPQYYAQMRSVMPMIKGEYAKTIKHMHELEKIYEPAVYPPVYLMVGNFTAGGRISDTGLLIGVEYYSKTPTSSAEGFSKNRWAIIRNIKSISTIITHELVHFQQLAVMKKEHWTGTLLSQAILEGTADFIAELTSGNHINDVAHTYAKQKEKILWQEFQTKMHGKDYKGWMYDQNAGRPADLGYWMGYEIVKYYYDHAADKKAAIKNIINPGYAKDFLKISGYADKHQ